MENVQRTVANRIKTFRKKAGMSQTELAAKCNVSKSMISKIESNKATVHLDMLMNIAKALGINLFDLLEQSNLATKRRATIVRERERKHLVTGVPGKTGYTYYRMAGSNDIDTFLMVVGKEAIASKRFVTHNGHEFIYVVEGSVRLQFRDEEYTLYEGDTAFFQGSQEHTILPASGESAQLILIFFHW
ncbi:MAG TPA: XRE family transcriptional regulator [Syntrophomonadaceae bacterium]|nr:XRE family transcriptional regulator [Syntrophomonadaceae bacterium]HPU48334.1 XRE family transcriptional regulator [Syntrophomonadaceae bacterium]